MTRALPLGTVLFLAVACSKPSPGGEKPAASAPAAQSGVVNVSVSEEGFKPDNITVKKGASVTLRFTRTTDDTCATKVVFPDEKIEKDLPLYQPVDIPIDTKEARTLAFQCGMGMYKSKVVIQ
jgi:plastocyanin domain-containing protein